MSSRHSTLLSYAIRTTNRYSIYLYRPFLVYPFYQPQISESDVHYLELEHPHDALIISLVTVKDDPKYSTANLQGPLVINTINGKGKQIICDEKKYPLHYKIGDKN